MIPLYDEKSPTTSPAYVTLSLIVINVLIFISTFFSGEFKDILFTYGAVPSNILAGQQWLGIILYMFLHLNPIHLIGNMWFLWIFGDNVEYNFGKIRYLIFFFIIGFIALFAQIFMTSGADLKIPIIGASGAISGIIGAYLVLYPKNKIKTLFLLFYYPLFFSIPAYFYIGIWFLYQLLTIGSITNVAYIAHIGGFIAGMLLASFFKRKVTIIENYDSNKIISGEKKLINSTAGNLNH